MVNPDTQLNELVKSFNEALQYWKKTLNETNSVLSDVESSKVENPRTELSKLADLVKAHTTKVGIIFKPERLKKSAQAAYETLKRLVETMILVMSVLSQMREAPTSKIFYQELVTRIGSLIDSNLLLMREISREMVSNDKDNEAPNERESNEGDVRLVSVGQIWTNCDSIVELIKGGEVGLLSIKINEGIELINDGLGDFEDWTNNPIDSDDDDPFGMDEFASDSEFEEPPAEAKDEISDDKRETKSDEVIEFAKKLVQKVKLIKLLMFSVSKSLPSVTEPKAINSVYTTQKHLVKLIDQLTLDIVLDKTVDEEITHGVETLTKHCKDLLKITAEVNAENENKVAWCKTWKAKYDAI